MKEICVCVKMPFIDRYTGMRHKVGDMLAVTEARYREINRYTKHVEIVPANKKKETK